MSFVIQRHLLDALAAELFEAGVFNHFIVISRSSKVYGCGILQGESMTFFGEVWWSGCCCRLDPLKLTEGQELQLRELHEQEWLNAFDLVLGQVNGNEEGELNVAQFKDHSFVKIIPYVYVLLLKNICLALHSLMSGISWWCSFRPHSTSP